MTPLAEPTFMTKAQAQTVYDVLVAECQAMEASRTDFVSNFTAKIARTANTREYRFGGSLGFGGKFYFTPRKWYVACYPEDETSERIAAIERANVRLEIVKGSA
jgi:hypothetical protein